MYGEIMVGVPLAFNEHAIRKVTPVLKQSDKERESALKRNFYKWLKTCLAVLFLMILLVIIFFPYSRDSHLTIGLKKIDPFFVGRENELIKLKKALINRKTRTSTLVALCGDAGVGKSELAAVFANKYYHEFSYVFWMNASTEDLLKESYRTIAETFNISTTNSEGAILDFESLFKRVHNYLENKELKKPWLLILDNVESLTGTVPSRGGAILMTCRHKGEWLIDKEIEVLPNPKESIELFQKISGEKKSLQMEQLASEANYLPLMIQHMARFIRETPGVSVESFCHAIEKNKSFYLCYPFSERITGTYDYIFEKLSRHNPLAFECLRQIAELDSDNIPVSFVKEWLENRSEKIPFVLEQILRDLRSFSLIHYQKQSHMFSIHRLLQEVLIHHKPKSQVYREELLDALLAYSSVKNYNPTHEETIMLFRSFLPHCVAFIEKSDHQSLKDIRLLLIVARYFLDTEKDLKKAEAYLSLAEENGERLNHPIKGRIAFLMGMLHKEKPRILGVSKKEALQTALTYFKKARVFFEYYAQEEDYYHLEQNPDKCNPGYQKAISILSQAQVLNELDELEEAEGLLNRAYDEYKTLFQREEHFDIARIIREQAVILRKKEKLVESKDKFEMALDMQRKIYGKRFDSQPSVASTLEMLGDAYADLDDFHRADKMYEQSILVNQNAYKTDVHPHIIRLFQKREEALQKLGKRRLSQKIRVKSLELQRQLST